MLQAGTDLLAVMAVERKGSLTPADPHSFRWRSSGLFLCLENRFRVLRIGTAQVAHTKAGVGFIHRFLLSNALSPSECAPVGALDGSAHPHC
mmetsp:Transcript_12410/g.33233  ORF Transcript_12410/g.33233 Transcript_12410/m.33233 type:complete len:92 (-) Transcript_12410:630-905(-)